MASDYFLLEIEDKDLVTFLGSQEGYQYNNL